MIRQLLPQSPFWLLSPRRSRRGGAWAWLFVDFSAVLFSFFSVGGANKRRKTRKGRQRYYKSDQTRLLWAGRERGGKRGAGPCVFYKGKRLRYPRQSETFGRNPDARMKTITRFYNPFSRSGMKGRGSLGEHSFSLSI